jgi:putative transposase
MRQPIHSEQFQRPLADNVVSCSMSRRGNVWNQAIKGAIGSIPTARAAMECFFSSLKTGKTENKFYRSGTEAEADVSSYVNRFSNPRRWHSMVGYISSIEFEKRAGLA